MKLLEVKMKYIMPNFRHEWEEAKRYPELEEKGEYFWLDISKNGKKVRLSSLGNVSNMDNELFGLDPEKVKRAKASFENGNIELPIVIKINGSNDLLGGNTRIAYLQSKNIAPQVWFIDVDSLLKT